MRVLKEMELLQSKNSMEEVTYRGALMVSLTDLRSICTSAGCCAAASVLPTDASININLYKNEPRRHLMHLMLSITIHVADVLLKAAVLIRQRAEVSFHNSCSVSASNLRPSLHLLE